MGGNEVKRPINVETVARKNEPIERLIKRFAKKIKKELIIEGIIERKNYEKPSEKKRRVKKRRKATLDKLKRTEETN